MLKNTPGLVDSHAHLDGKQFAGDLEAVLGRAREAGVSDVLTIGCDLESSRRSVELALRYPEVHASVGIHPHDAASLDAETLAELERMAETVDKVVAIGEIGLDYYRDRAPRDLQRTAFRQQIRLAAKLGKPVIVHDRDAHDEVLQILKEEAAGKVAGVLHCFSGDLEMARACVAMGFLISFAGPLTYPKNDALRAIAADLPIDVMLVETDCPYLAPQKWRGKRNEPAYVQSTAEMLAEVKGLSLQDVARVTSLNAFRLFGIGKIDQSARIAYVIRNSLYLNITNRCTNQCTFCAKFSDFTVKGHQLCLEKEPSAAEVIAAIGDPQAYAEVVFCGYGEPLVRLDLVKEVAAWLKQHGVTVRINTDGQANLVHGRNILPELAGLVDAVSVSLNAPNAAQYQEICQSAYGEAAYAAVQQFLKEAGQWIPSVTATAVSLPGVDIAACRQVARQLGVAFRERPYNEVG
ncbi:MAG TPA: TatD family nuclease-associated radical SAM protein [Desulfuromonadales bacterium]|nr:TatD family nuclease-associated radical SAM protein [Desulfuromonadales bacterium]